MRTEEKGRDEKRRGEERRKKLIMQTKIRVTKNEEN